MNNHTLYIGHNNDTKKVEKDKIVKIISRHFDGFTIMPTLGYWGGEEEESVAVIIFTDKTTKVEVLVEILKIQLNQDAILLQYPNGTGELI